MTIVVVGAGDIGGALTRQLAAADIAGRVVLVDEAGSIAAGKALDVAQASPVDGYSTAVVGTTDVAAVAGAAIIVLADRAGQPGGDWADEPGLALVKRIAGLNQVAPIVCAGASQVSIIERGVREAGLPRARLFGTAPEAYRGAIAALTALEAGAVPADVSLVVVGRAPQQVIVPWDEAVVGGRRATEALGAAQIARLDARLPRLWPPGPYALAAAATAMLRSALTRSPRVHVAMVALTRDEGSPGRAAMLPVTVSPAGLSAIVTPSLSARDRVRLDTTLRS